MSNIEKRGRGRPSTDATPVLVRLQPPDLKSLDSWIKAQEEPMTRPEAIRTLVRDSLK